MSIRGSLNVAIDEFLSKRAGFIFENYIKTKYLFQNIFFYIVFYIVEISWRDKAPPDPRMVSGSGSSNLNESRVPHMAFLAVDKFLKQSFKISSRLPRSIPSFVRAIQRHLPRRLRKGNLGNTRDLERSCRKRKKANTRGIHRSSPQHFWRVCTSPSKRRTPSRE